MRNLFFKSGKLLALLLLLNLQGVAQYVSLEGRQFKLNGNDFYPLVCNYSFEIIYNGSNSSSNPPLSSLYLSPSRNYGIGSTVLSYLPNNNFDFDNPAAALAHIDADFQKIHAMGFNTIRTHGITVNMYNAMTDNFYYEIIPNYHIDPIQFPLSYSKSIMTPYSYSTNSNLAKLWDFYAQIFTLANQNDLKVLLDVAGGTIGSHTYSTHHTAYKNYLAALADHFKNNTDLMAYVVIEEPDDEKTNNSGNKKADICTYTTEWYDAIKGTSGSPNDINHLVTASCIGIGTVFEWDPGIMKLDFFSPHIYPGTELFEGYSTAEPYNRVLGYINWLKNNCPMPWITGETGFSACDDSYFTNTLPAWSPIPLAPPWDYGSLTEQHTFAVNVLDAVRDAGGSGFSWWNYQENWWPYVEQEGHGLIDHSGNDKPVVAAFTNYLSSTGQSVNSGSGFTPPSNYENPYNTGSGTPFSYNTPNTNMLSGDVFDANTGLGIKDAFVFSWNWLKTIDGPDGLPCTSDDNHSWSGLYTFTDINGHFKITPYNYLQPGIVNPHRISEIRVSATGAERAFDGPWCNNFFTSSTILLDRHNIEYDALVQNLTINPGSKNFRGANTLTASNVTILSGAISDITASKQITINTEFDAKFNSEVHIFTSETQECPSFTSFAKIAINSQNHENVIEENEITSIEVAFKPKSTGLILSVIPNPTDGRFTVELLATDIKLQQFGVKIFDMYGKKIYECTETKKSFVIDITSHPFGLYTLQITNNEKSLIKKIILK